MTTTPLKDNCVFVISNSIASVEYTIVRLKKKNKKTKSSRWGWGWRMRLFIILEWALKDGPPVNIS